MVNLFWLSPPRYVRGRGLNYSWCARQHIDAHIIKIPLEAAQLLYGAHHALPTGDDWRTRAPMAGTGERGYKPTHMNNPISKWLRESSAHYRHAVAYGLALCEEYSHRYGREHACEAHLHWLKTNEPAIPDVNDHPNDEEEVDRFRIARAPPCAMPDEFKVVPPEDAEADVKEEGVDTSAVDDGNLPEEPEQAHQGKGKQEGTTDEPEDEEATIVREAQLAKEIHTAAGSDKEEEMETKVTKVEVELRTSQGDITIKTETSEASMTTTTVATDDADEERAENLLLPIEEEVAASEVAFPLHVYQSYRAYYLGQKLSLKMSTFKTRDVPHWALERVLEIKALPKPTPQTKKKSVTTRTRRTTTTTTTTTTVKRKRETAAKSEEDEGEEADEDYIENRRLTRSRSRARKEREQREDEEKGKSVEEEEVQEDPRRKELPQRSKAGRKRKAVKPQEEPVEEPSTKEKDAAKPRRGPRSSVPSATTADAALSKRRRVAKELK